MLSGFLGQVQQDFAMVASAEYSEEAIVSDGVTTLTVPCLFDEPAQHFDPETQSHVIYAESRFTIAETAYPDFDFRRPGLSVTIRGTEFKTRRSDWTFDGIGALTMYLDRVNPQP